MSIEKNYSIRFVASLALREKQIQQIYRPIIAVHKWFARRPGSLFRGLLLSEFGNRPVEDTYYQVNSFEGLTIAIRSWAGARRFSKQTGSAAT